MLARNLEGEARKGGQFTCGSQTRARSLAAGLPELCFSRHPLQRKGAGKTGRRLAPIKTPMRTDCTRNAQGSHRAAETRPSLRDGLTAYAVLSPETSSFLPPSPPRNARHRAG